jgi:hypothetical protein
MILISKTGLHAGRPRSVQLFLSTKSTFVPLVVVGNLLDVTISERESIMNTARLSQRIFIFKEYEEVKLIKKNM